MNELPVTWKFTAQKTAPSGLIVLTIRTQDFECRFVFEPEQANQLIAVLTSPKEPDYEVIQ